MVIISIALIGSLLLLITNASSLFVQTELENASLSNGATKLSDSNASSGSLVVFGNSQTGSGASNQMNLFISNTELMSVKAKYAARQEPWFSAGNAVMGVANAELSKSYYSVVNNGGGANYYTDPPYTSDGVINPNVDRSDYIAAGGLGKAVRSLAIAYQLTGDTKYADKAVYFLDKWMVDSTTYMNPKYTGGQSGIELSITMPAIFYGIDLLEPYPGWSVSSKQSVLSWVSSFSDNAAAQNWSAQNNWQDWLNVTVASSAALIGNSERLNGAINKWKTRLDAHVNTSGFFTQEITRTLSLDYSMFAMDAFTQTALIAKHNGTDLFSYTSPTGKSLKLTYDKHAGYLVNPATWPYKQISSYKGGEVAIYEVAYQVYGQANYKQVIDYWKRPMNDVWSIGITSFTHAKDSY